MLYFTWAKLLSTMSSTVKCWKGLGTIHMKRAHKTLGTTTNNLFIVYLSKTAFNKEFHSEELERFGYYSYKILGTLPGLNCFQQ